VVRVARSIKVSEEVYQLISKVKGLIQYWEGRQVTTDEALKRVLSDWLKSSEEQAASGA